MLLKDTMERVDATTAVVTLSGRMTHGMRLREVESQINQAVDDGVRVLVVDIGGIEYSDSAGLGLLMLLYGKMKTVKGSPADCRTEPHAARALHAHQYR